MKHQCYKLYKILVFVLFIFLQNIRETTTEERIWGSWLPWNCACCKGTPDMHLIRIRYKCCFTNTNHTAVCAGVDQEYDLRSGTCKDACSDSGSPSHADSVCYRSVLAMPYSCLTDNFTTHVIESLSSSIVPTTAVSNSSSILEKDNVSTSKLPLTAIANISTITDFGDVPTSILPSTITEIGNVMTSKAASRSLTITEKDTVSTSVLPLRTVPHLLITTVKNKILTSMLARTSVSTFSTTVDKGNPSTPMLPLTTELKSSTTTDKGNLSNSILASTMIINSYTIIDLNNLSTTMLLPVTNGNYSQETTTIQTSVQTSFIDGIGKLEIEIGIVCASVAAVGVLAGLLSILVKKKLGSTVQPQPDKHCLSERGMHRQKLSRNDF